MYHNIAISEFEVIIVHLLIFYLIINARFIFYRYLNISNNNILINWPEEKLPWQKMRTNNLANLVELNLSKNNKSGVFSSLALPRRLSISSTTSASTDLKQNILSQTAAFNCFVNLRKLDLSENNLHNIPVDIKDLRHLEELNLANNQLEFFANELTELCSLRILLLGANQIFELTDAFCAYAQFRRTLIRLDLHANKLKTQTFSTKIGLFENLEFIDLSENLFESMPATLPKNLIEIKMNKNRIRTLLLRPLSSSVLNDEDLAKALGLEKPRRRRRNFNSIVRSSLTNKYRKPCKRTHRKL